MEVWRITKGGVLDECMIEWPQLTDGDVRRLWPMREGDSDVDSSIDIMASARLYSREAKNVFTSDKAH